MKSGGDALADRTSRTQADDDELTRVLEAYLADAEAGRAVDPERLVAEHPSIAEPLRACLMSLRFIESAADSLTSSVEETGGGGPPQLGDYRIVREVGRGGMGIVYEAEQVSLGRRVALKVLPFAAVLDPKQLQRFKNEAQAAAQLHHTNIVPVFSVGCERGVHYYAMQFIDGRTLAEAIREMRAPPGPGAAPPRGPAFFRTAAGLGLQAADALDHAHRSGIVHRDVKPSNLLLDGEGNLWITDFGVARFPDGAGLTLSGDVLGTLRYMSPEQALGKRSVVDHRADIYSLGATLYELLTLEPAFPGEDREEVLRRIAFEEPRAPRRIDASVPLELETVVLKAMAKEPEARYETAKDLADDLRRYLEDKPVLAQRPSLLERAAKWARRHRSVVRAAVGFLVLSVIVLAASTVIVLREQGRTRSALARAEASFGKARSVVDRMFTWVSEDPLAKTPHMEAARRTLLEEAAKFYRGFLEEKGDDPAVRREAGQAHLRLGKIHEMLGRFAEAEEAYRKGMEILTSLASSHPETAGFGHDAAEAHRLLARVLGSTGRSREGLKEVEEAVAGEEKLNDLVPGSPDDRLELATARHDLGSHLYSLGQIPQAIEENRKALSILEEIEGQSPGNTRYQQAAASVYHSLGMEFKDTGRIAEAEDSYRRALDRLKRLSSAEPSPSAFLHEAGTHYSLGLLLAQTDQGEPARKCYEEALALQSKLVADYPGVPDYKNQLAFTWDGMGTLAKYTGQPQDAEMCNGEALKLKEKNAADFPQVPEYRSELGRSHNNFGILLQDILKRLTDAQSHYTQARQIFAKLVEEHPQNPDYREGLGQSWNNLGSLFLDTGKLDESLGAFEEARRLFLSLAEENPRSPDFRYYHAMSVLNVGNVCLEKKNAGRACDLLAQAIEQNRKDFAAFPRDGRFPQIRRAFYGALVDALGARHDHAELARRGDELAGAAPGSADDLFQAACMFACCTRFVQKDTALPEAEREAKAESYAGRAMELLRTSIEKGFKDIDQLKTNPALDPLRGREDFRKLLGS